MKRPPEDGEAEGGAAIAEEIAVDIEEVVGAISAEAFFSQHATSYLRSWDGKALPLSAITPDRCEIASG